MSGVFREFLLSHPPTFGHHHPLGVTRDIGGDRRSDHLVLTTRATGSPTVTQSITVTTPRRTEKVEQQPGFRRADVVREVRTTEVTFDLPPDDTGLADSVTLRQLGNDLDKQWSELGSGSRADDYALIYEEEMRQMRATNEVLNAAARLDPLDSKQWRDRLS